MLLLRDMEPIQTGTWKFILGGAVTIVATVVDALAYYIFGVRSGVFVADGIVTSCVLVFILCLLAFYEKGHPEKFESGPAVRTAIAITFSVAYLELLAWGLVASDLGLNFHNPLMSNFFWVYSTIIGFYFGTLAAERIKGAKPAGGDNGAAAAHRAG